MDKSSSTWQAFYTSHAFHGSWERLVRAIEDPALTADVAGIQLADIVRLRKVVGFLTGVLESLDPELVPRSTWAGCQSHVEASINQVAAYASSRSEGHLIAANENVDVVLDVLARYASEDAKRRGSAVIAQRTDDQLSILTKHTIETAQTFHREIEKARTDASEQLSAIRETRFRAADYHTKLLEGTDAEPSIKTRIDGFLVEAGTKAQEIKDFHASLIVGTAKEESTQAQVKSAATKITETQSQMNAMLDTVTEATSELAAFHKRVFGDGKSEVGLKAEIETRLESLAEYDESLRLRHKALSDQVEELLPGATSAGLATAFRKMREEFTAPIATYTRVFYISITLMLLVALGASLESITLFPPSWTVAHSKEWSDTLRRIIERAPVLLPLVWLAIFSATRRSQYERLQQEYAHKQALASSYESYKRQLTELGTDSEAILKDLISRAVETVAFNASTTLDGKHDQAPPVQQLLAKLKSAEAETILERLRTMK